MVTKSLEVHEVNLYDLLTLIQNGTEIILMDGEKPLARVLPIEGRRIAGLSRGAIRTSDDFEEPLDDSFWLGEA